MNPSPELFAKLLPDVVAWDFEVEKLYKLPGIGVKGGPIYHNPVLETEYLHLCHLAVKRLSDTESSLFAMEIRRMIRDEYLAKFLEGGFAVTPDGYFYNATWQQRLTALAQVKGVGL